MKTILAVALMFLCLPLAAAEAPADVDSRIAKYQRLVETYPVYAPFTLELADGFLQKARETGDSSYVDRAEKLAQKTLAASAGNYLARRVLVQIALVKHEFSKAVAEGSELAAEMPTDATAWAVLGDALMERGEYGKAWDAYQKLAALKPGMISYNRLGWYHFVHGDTGKAIELMNKAVTQAHGYAENKAWCLTELGNLYWKMGNVDGAAAAFEQAIAVFPGMHAAHAGLGNTRMATNRLEDAIGQYRQAQAIVPLVQYAAVLGDLYRAVGQTELEEQQRNLVDQLARLEKASNQKANRTLAMIYANQERHLEEAMALAQGDLEARSDVYSWDAMSWVLYKNRQFTEARAASLKALRTNTPDPSLYYHAGMIAREAGEAGEARKMLRKALDLNAHFDLVQTAVALRALEELGERAEGGGQ